MYDAIKAGLLFNAASIPCEKFMRLCRDYGEFEPRDSLFDALGMTSSQKSRLVALLAKDGWAERELERLAGMGGRFITANSADYPARLLGLKNPPTGLYVIGPLNLALPSVSIVGTRRPSSYGLETAFILAKMLARNGITVISGGAKGIDAASHKGALSVKGCTIAVFGTGLDRIYPVEHRRMFEEIAVNGALVTEYPLGTNGEGWRFVARDRLIAGLSSKVVVVESPEEGGALHTAKYCRELGHELWVVPGRISDEVCTGSNRLLQDGAGAVVSIEEFAGKREQLTFGFERTELSEDDKRVYALLQKKGGRTLDNIAAESGIDASVVSGAVVMLEADGLVESRGGRYYETGTGSGGISTQDTEAPSSSDPEQKIYNFLKNHPNSTLDNIITELELEAQDASIALISLEAQNLILLSGGRYSLTD